jgi:predicted DNA-binding transcriptional regulator YafY
VNPNAADQFNRIVTLVAELNLAAAEGEMAPTLAALAERHGVTEDEILGDVRALTHATDNNTDWLASLRIAQEADRLSVTTQGPYRRPVRFTADEALALQVGLALEDTPTETVSKALTELVGAKPVANAPPIVAGPCCGVWEEEVVDRAREAVERRRVLEIKYAGEGDKASVDRVVEPHQVVHHDGRFYLIAWCRQAGDWRHFRADRVTDAMLGEQSFAWREEFTPLHAPEDVFRAVGGEPAAVEVRFSPRIARWIRERYPSAKAQEDGSAVLTYRVADRNWLVRTVLEYGDDAEVVSPEPYRSAMRRAVE